MSIEDSKDEPLTVWDRYHNKINEYNLEQPLASFSVTGVPDKPQTWMYGNTTQTPSLPTPSFYTQKAIGDYNSPQLPAFRWCVILTRL